MRYLARTAFGLALDLSTTCAYAEVTPERARDIAEEAYIYGFPIVMHFKTMTAYVLDTTSPEYKAPFNKLGCKAQVYTPEDKAIVTPNSDTPYCMGYLDLSAEPVVISVPQIAPERYYSMQMIDLFTHNIGYIGNLTTGSDAGNYLMTGPGWDGELPSEIDAVIPSETDLVLIINRTQFFAPMICKMLLIFRMPMTPNRSAHFWAVPKLSPRDRLDRRIGWKGRNLMRVVLPIWTIC